MPSRVKSYKGYSPSKCTCNGHATITIMSILEWNLHDMNEMLLLVIPVISPHQLLSICNMPCMKKNLQNKDIVLFVDNPPILISGHTPIIYFVDNPLIYIIMDILR